MFDKILETASYLKAKIKKDDLEIALADATSEENWQTSASVLHVIASSAYDHEKWKRIKGFLWERLKGNVKWKKLLKCLNIVEFLLKNGPTFACSQFKYELRFFKSLESYQEFEQTVDRGASVRERASSITRLLQNDELLEDERLLAHQIREKMSHVSGGTNYSSEGPSRPASSYIPKYESYNNETFGKAQDSRGFYNYGGGNYGDRSEDKKFDHDYFGNHNRFTKPQSDKPKPAYTPDRQSPQLTKPSNPSPQSPKRSPARTNFSTLNQSLMSKAKGKLEKPAVKQGNIIKPDLSYKKKQQPDQLIDLEEAFMETRYHFEDKPQNITHSNDNVIQPAALPTITNNPPAAHSNLLNQLGNLSFFGAEQPSKQKAENSPAQVQATVALSTPSSVPAFIPTSIPVTNQGISLSPSTFSTLIQSPPKVQEPSFSLYGNNPTQPVLPPYGLNSNPSPYSFPGTYNQFNTFNSYGPNYYNPSPNIYPNPPPAYNYSSGYQQPTLPSYNAPTNPYQAYNLASNSAPISLGVIQDKNKETIQKPSTASSRPADMGNLTDLSDLMSEITQQKKTAPSKGNPAEIDNKIKIDKWAW